MTHLNTGSVQIPPDSTGKRISTTQRTLLYFDNLQSGKSFQVGDIVTTDAGASATVEGVNTAGFTANAGALYLSNVSGTFADDAQLKVGGVYFANVNLSSGEGEAVTTYFIQNQVLVDGQNPERRAGITDQSELKVTLPEGSLDSNDAVKVLDLTVAKGFNFDYVINSPDPDIASITVAVKYTNGVGIGSGFTAGSFVRGATSSAYGQVLSTDTANSILYIKNIVLPTETNFQVGETIQNIDIDAVESCEVVGVGTIVGNQTTRALELSTNGTVAGLKCKQSTHFYQPLGRGSSTEVQFAVSTTEATPGVTRRFGLYDENQGYYWEILESNGTNTDYDESGGVDTGGNTIFRVVHRTNTGGSVVNDSVSQEDFSENSLDGTDNQAFTIDFANVNNYFITIPNDGAGVANFGVFNSNGERIVAHRFVFSNNPTYPDNPNPLSTIPLNAEVINNGAGSPAQATTLKINKINILKYTNEKEQPSFNHSNSQRDLRTFDSTAGEIPIMGIRARATFGPNGYANKITSRLNEVSVSMLDSRIDREFNAATAVNSGTDTITLKNHGLNDGEPVFYQNNGNADIAGLEDYGIYYAITVDDDSFKLSPSYTGAVVDAEAVDITSTGVGNHKIVGITDGPAIIRLRKNSSAADMGWNPHNAVRSSVDWGDGATGFRIAPVVGIINGGGGYNTGDLLEFNAGIKNHREAVVKVCETNAGVITRVRIAPTGDAYGQEADGTTSANFGSYNGKFTGQTVGHKPSGEGQSVCAGSGAIFGSAVDWGHGFWWNSIYGQWFEFELDDKNSHLGKQDNLDIFFQQKYYEDGVFNLVLTAEAQADKKSVHIQSNLNWDEII